MFRHVFFVVFILLTLCPPSAARADGSAGTLVGSVVDQRSALPINGASVEVRRASTVVAATSTDAFGNFGVSVPPGTYDVTVRAKGYAPSSILNVAVIAGSTLAVDAALVAAVSASNVHTIGTVTVSANALASATTITQVVSVQNVSQTGQIRFADQLATLPAMNFATSSSPGDDASVDIRGFGASGSAAGL
jgi:hypothetical protein